MNELAKKLQSRKFWMAVAAFLASIGTGIAGIATGNEKVAIAGGILVVLSSAIYAACEAYVDGQSVKTTTTQTTISASSTDKTVVAAALTKEN